MRGYMWKRGPRADDKDKKSLTRFLFKSDGYKRRYFVLDNVKLELTYYSDYSKDTALGCIDLLTVVSVSYEGSGEDLPSKFPLCITTKSRDWSMCCENAEDFNIWKREIASIMKRREKGSGSDANNFTERSALTSLPNANAIQRIVMDESDLKNKDKDRGRDNGNDKSIHRNTFRKSKVSTMFNRSKNAFPGDTFDDEMLQLQRARLGEETVYNSYTGNVSIAATSAFSRYESLEKLDFFQVLMTCCDDHLDISTRRKLVTKFLSDCQFEIYMEEGKVLISEGSKFEWVYFVLEGEIEQRKNWTSSPLHIDEKILSGQCIGFVEVLHFNGVSTTTLLVGPGTICLKMDVKSFEKRFQSSSSTLSSKFRDIKDVAIFSSSMDPSSTLYRERLTTFAYKRLLNFPLLERQPVGNIQTFSHIFSPVFIPSGDYLMHEGEASNDFYILVEGSCSVLQKSSLSADEVDEIVRSCRGGDWLGEAGLINIQSQLITVAAHSDVVALHTDAAGFKRFLDIVGPSVREVLTQSTTAYLKTMLKTIPLFVNIDESHLVDICHDVEIKELERDTILFDTGDKIEQLFVILHGRVECSISFVSGLDLSKSPPFIETLRENDFFGESSVLYESAPSRLQYYTPKDVKVIVLCIPAKKLKPFLPMCPTLQLRFEERLLVRKTHMDLINTLVDSISSSLDTRYTSSQSPTLGRHRTQSSKQSLGHMADVKAKESINLSDEVMYLREEVKRLNGVQYPAVAKERSQSKALYTFKSTLRKIKDSLPSSQLATDRKKKQGVGSKEEDFTAKGTHSPFYRSDENTLVATTLGGSESADITNGMQRKEKVHHFHGSDSDSDSQEEMDNNEGILSDFDSSDSSVDFMFRENAEAQKSVMNALDVHSDEEFDDGQMQQTKAMLDARGKSTDKKINEKMWQKRVTDIEGNTSTEEATPSISPSQPPPPPPPLPPANQTSSSKSFHSRSNVVLSRSAAAAKSSVAKSSVTACGNSESTSESFTVDAMYDRMLKMKLPEAAIRKKMKTDGVPPEAIDIFFRNNISL